MQRIRPLPIMLALALLAVPGSVVAQEAAEGRLRVVVTDSATREPLARARVALLGGGGGVTGDDGRLGLEGVAPGARVVEVSHLGYTGRRVLVRVAARQTAVMQVALAVAPVALPGIEATGVRALRTRLLLSFYARASTGTGQYITRDQIERLNPREVSDLFKMVPGMVVQSAYTGDRLRMEGGSVSGGATEGRGRNSRVAGRARDAECPVLYFLDGTPLEVQDGVIDAEVDPVEVEGIEIYRRGTAAPPQFRRGDNCGVILIWKRERLEPRRRR